MNKWYLAGIPLLFSGSLFAQQINPTNQINWPQATGSGAPTAPCTAGNFGQPYTDVTNNNTYTCSGSGWVEGSSGGGGNPGGPANSIQINSGSSTFNGDANFTINATTHTRTSTATDIFNAINSVPKATVDPISTQYCTTTGTSACGLLAAIAVEGTNPSAPTQVLQAAEDAQECAIQTGTTSFKGIRLPLPANLTIDIGGLKLWSNTDFGGEDGSISRFSTLQHNDNTVYMVQLHQSGDTLTCGGTTYHPSVGSNDYIHDFAIAGMFAPATTTDAGIVINGVGDLVRNIVGAGNIFGGPAIYLSGTSVFADHLGYPDGNLQGCKTYNGGVLPVSSFGPGNCESVMSDSLDGGIDHVYATDTQAQQSGHAVGSCYPLCAAVGLGGSGGYGNDIFAQISSQGILVNGANVRGSNWRIDDTSREGVRFASTGAPAGNDLISKVNIDTSCADTALQSAYNAGTATGCASIRNNALGTSLSQFQVFNSSGIFSQSYNQCWVWDNATGASGASNVYNGLQGDNFNPQNTTANDWAYCGLFIGDQISGRAEFPVMSPMQATTTTPNVSGLNAIVLTGQTITNMVAGIAGQAITVYGPGTISNAAGGTGQILNSSGLAVTLGAGNIAQYRNVNTLANPTWVMTSGPPQLTPTHVNYSGNTTPSNPSLIDVFGNAQARQVPLPVWGGAFQLSGATTTGSAVFVLETLFPDGSHAVSAPQSTTIALPTAGGAIFGTGPNTVNGAITNLWLISDTQPTTVPLGKYPAVTCTPTCFWSNTVVQAGGNGATPVVASDNTTGQVIATGGEVNNLNGVFNVDANSPSSCTVNGTNYSTNFDCAFQQAKYWVSIHSNLNATVMVGSNGMLTTLLGGQMPTAAGNHGTVNIIGQGVNASYLQLTGSLGTTCMITQPDEATAGNSAYQRIEGLTLDLNNDSQCAMSIDGVKSSYYGHLRILNVATSTSGSGGAAVKFADTVQAGQVFDTTLDDISVDVGGAGGYTAAGFTCTALGSPGNPVCSVSSGGSFPANTGNVVETWGTGNGSGACSVYPTWTVTYSGSGPYTVTGLTASGGTCLGTVYPSLQPPPIADYVFKFANEFTDNDVNYLRAVMPTNFATLQVKGHPNVFKHYHPYSGQPVGIEDYGGNIFIGTECDTVGGYCAAIEGLGSIYVQTSSLYNNFTGNQGSGLFYVDTSVTTTPTFNSIGVTCNGNRQTRGGYSKLVIGNGLPYNNTSSTGGAIENGVAIPNPAISMENTLDCGTSPTTNTFYSHIGSLGLQFGGIAGQATAPSGTCAASFGGQIVFSQDGHATYCPTGGGTWTSKF